MGNFEGTNALKAMLEGGQSQQKKFDHSKYVEESKKNAKEQEEQKIKDGIKSVKDAEQIAILRSQLDDANYRIKALEFELKTKEEMYKKIEKGRNEYIESMSDALDTSQKLIFEQTVAINKMTNKAND